MLFIAHPQLSIIYTVGSSYDNIHEAHHKLPVNSVHVLTDNELTSALYTLIRSSHWSNGNNTIWNNLPTYLSPTLGE